MILVFRKAKSCRVPNLDCRGCWVTWIIWCFTKKLCRRHDAWVGTLSWWSFQSPVAHSCSLLNHPDSVHRRTFKLNTKFDADLLLYSLRHFECSGHKYTCSLNGVYHPHWLVQWSYLCSHMHIPVRSSWLPGYIDVAQTILIILTMARLFLDRSV